MFADVPKFCNRIRQYDLYHAIRIQYYLSVCVVLSRSPVGEQQEEGISRRAGIAGSSSLLSNYNGVFSPQRELKQPDVARGKRSVRGKDVNP